MRAQASDPRIAGARPKSGSSAGPAPGSTTRLPAMASRSRSSARNAVLQKALKEGFDEQVEGFETQPAPDSSTRIADRGPDQVQDLTGAARSAIHQNHVRRQGGGPARKRSNRLVRSAAVRERWTPARSLSPDTEVSRSSPARAGPFSSRDPRGARHTRESQVGVEAGP